LLSLSSPVELGLLLRDPQTSLLLDLSAMTLAEKVD